MSRDHIIIALLAAFGVAELVAHLLALRTISQLEQKNEVLRKLMNSEEMPSVWMGGAVYGDGPPEPMHPFYPQNTPPAS